MKEIECQGILSTKRAAHYVCRMETLRSQSLATFSKNTKISFSLYLCGLNITLIHWELSLLADTIIIHIFLQNYDLFFNYARIFSENLR